MIFGTGVDIVSIERLRPWLEKPHLLERYFASEELEEVRAKGRGEAASLAARFAAKEAFGKALGIGLRGIILKDLFVRSDSLGKPVLALRGSAAAALRERCPGGRVHLSLAHDGEAAVAQVIIEEGSHG